MTVIDRGGKRERVVCLECRAIHTRAKCPKVLAAKRERDGCRAAVRRFQRFADAFQAQVRRQQA